jgi:hypothetical protein
MAEGNRKIEEGTYKVNKVEGRIAKEEAIMVTLGKSGHY